MITDWLVLKEFWSNTNHIVYFFTCLAVFYYDDGWLDKDLQGWLNRNEAG